MFSYLLLLFSIILQGIIATEECTEGHVPPEPVHVESLDCEQDCDCVGILNCIDGFCSWTPEETYYCDEQRPDLWDTGLGGAYSDCKSFSQNYVNDWGRVDPYYHNTYCSGIRAMVADDGSDRFIWQVCSECGRCTLQETVNPTVSPSQLPSKTPTTDMPSHLPSTSPTPAQPTTCPTFSKPTVAPSHAPSTSPESSSPTSTPSKNPSATPSTSPSSCPTSDSPSISPSTRPSTEPSTSPTSDSPSVTPSVAPTQTPTTDMPSTSPVTSRPTVSPTQPPVSSSPSHAPSLTPSQNPTSSYPSTSPSKQPSTNPTVSPPTTSPVTSAPSPGPSKFPTVSPSASEPTTDPTTSVPTEFPTTSKPTKSPTSAPTDSPTTSKPTPAPTMFKLEITMQGNYEEVVGTKKAQWLQDCSTKLQPVLCVDVWSGSIVVQVQGEEDDVIATENEILENGLILDGWPALYAETANPIKDEAAEESVKSAGFPSFAIVLIVVAFLVVVALAFHFMYKTEARKSEPAARKESKTSFESIVKAEGNDTSPSHKRTSFAKDEEEKCEIEVQVKDALSIEMKEETTWKPKTPQIQVQPEASQPV